MESGHPSEPTAAETHARKNPFEATQCTPGLTFEQRYTECVFWVERKRRGIDLATLSWDDIRQMLLIRISQQYHVFDPARGPFKKWVNKVITHAICNIWRDHYRHVARPCVGCTENMGNDHCRRTQSGLQCSQCPAYREWEKRKKSHHDIKLAVSIENHVAEVSNTQGDFLDIEAKKKVIDTKMKERLTRTEYRAYRLLIIKGLSDEETAKAMGFKAKRGKKTRMFAGYLQILAYRHLFIEKAREIIESENLAA
jgi:DNA-directed RNA polymerase specialized sigma24 family protein